MKITSRHLVEILTHLDKLWDRKREKVKARHDLQQYEKHDRLNDLKSELIQIKEELFDILTDTNVKKHSGGSIVVSYNQEQVIIKVCDYGEYVVTPPEPNRGYGYVEHKEMI